MLLPWARRHASLRLSGRLAFLKCPNRRPRHFVPGYYQPVPPGQKPLTHRAPRIKLALMGRAPARSRRQASDGRVPSSALDGRCAPARPALHVSTRHFVVLYSALSIIAPSVNVLRRTRRKPSTIRGAAPDVVIGQSTAARAGARPYQLVRCRSSYPCGEPKRPGQLSSSPLREIPARRD